MSELDYLYGSIDQRLSLRRMDAKAKKIVALLADPDVSEFVDRDKFARSSYFTKLLQLAADHFRRHGDIGPATKLFAAIESTREYRPLLNRFCRDVGVALVEERPLSVRRASAPIVTVAKAEPAGVSVKGSVMDWKPAGKVAKLVLPRGSVSPNKAKAAAAVISKRKKKKSVAK